MRMPSSGVTLIELLIALSIIAITLGVAVPSFTGLIRETRLTTAVNSLHGALFYTRSEAIKRGRRVTMCTSVNERDCAIGVGWHGGWIVFEDANGNGLREEGETQLQVSGRLREGLRATGNGPVQNYVSYIPLGPTRTSGGGLQMGTITVCSGERARKIVISSSGRPRVVHDEGC